MIDFSCPWNPSTVLKLLTGSVRASLIRRGKNGGSLNVVHAPFPERLPEPIPQQPHLLPIHADHTNLPKQTITHTILCFQLSIQRDHGIDLSVVDHRMPATWCFCTRNGEEAVGTEFAVFMPRREGESGHVRPVLKPMVVKGVRG